MRTVLLVELKQLLLSGRSDPFVASKGHWSHHRDDIAQRNQQFVCRETVAFIEKNKNKRGLQKWLVWSDQNNGRKKIANI